MKNKVSIIIPVYNVEKYIRECLESVINQTYSELEIILVDDGSTDRSGNIVDEYAKRDGRICVVHRENGGLSVARNTGLEIMTGDYVFFLDSDDYIAKTTIARMLWALKISDSDLACCQWIKGKQRKERLSDVNKIGVFEGENVLNAVFIDKYTNNSACAKLYKSSLWKNNRFPIAQKYEDIIAIPIALEKCKRAVFLRDQLYYYRERDGSITHENSSENSKEFLRAIKIIDDYFRGKGLRYLDCFVFQKYNLLLKQLKITEDKKNYKEIFDFLKDNFWRLFRSDFVPPRKKVAIVLRWMKLTCISLHKGIGN